MRLPSTDAGVRGVTHPTARVTVMLEQTETQTHQQTHVQLISSP